MTILEKIIEKANKIDDERKRKSFLLKELETHFDEIPFAEIEKLLKSLEKDVEKLNKEVDKFNAKKKIK